MRHGHEDSPTDIAIVGVGCRFPGGVVDLDGYWTLISGSRTTVTEVPEDRWGDRFHDPDPHNPGTSYCARGSFLPGIDRFDADFFGISPREAHEIDPQQRLLLEASWAAMEDSGIPRERWEGSRTGVYMGILAMDYTVLHTKTSGTDAISPYYASGKEFSFGSGRISYTFGLHGPTLMLNTACSSSLTAVHLATRALRGGECDAALAGGVNLMLTPELGVFMSKVSALSPTGVCRPFDASADGVTRSEGCGVVVLKRYADAVADGDRVWAVIHGSALNHDGRSAGITAPNAGAQQELLRTALRDAGRTPAEVDYVEAHGTGTPLGDPLELGALAAVIGAERPAGRPLFVGSHKANFGHMDSAAGIAGLLKAVLVARRGIVPPQINLDRPTSQIDWAASGLAVATELTPLRPLGDRPLVGVSAFGLSGTNAHVLLGPPLTRAAAPYAGAGPSAPEGRPLPILTVSGHTEVSLRSQAAAYRDRLRTMPTAELPHLVHTAAARRSHHEHRVAVIGRTGAELADALDAHLAGREAPSVITGDAIDGGARAIVHAFPDSGAQVPSGVGLDAYLYDAHPVFAETLDECDALFAAHADWSLMTELRRAEDRGSAGLDVAQPIAFAVQLGLSRLWSSYGLAPDAVVGYGAGEICAAVVAGTLTLPDAAELVVHRGRLLLGATGSARAVAVELPAAEVRPFLDERGGEVFLAAVNGPSAVVVSGPAEPVRRVTAALETRGVRCTPLSGEHAVHTPAMRPRAENLARRLGHLAPRASKITLLSSVAPELDAPVTDAAYWARGLYDRVQLWPAVDRLLAECDAAFIEISADPVLDRQLRAALRHRRRGGPVVSSLRRGESADHSLARALAGLHVAGVPVEWPRVIGRRRYLPLPPLPLAGDSYWLPGVARGAQGGTSPEHGGLTAEVRLYDAAGRAVTTLTTASVPPAAHTTPVSAASPTPASPVGRAVAVSSVPVPAEARAELPLPAPTAAPDPVAQTAAPEPAGADRQGAAAGRHERIAVEISRLYTAAIGQGSEHRVPRRRGFFELGMDSFSLNDFIRAVERKFDITLDEAAGLRYPTITQLADHIATLIGDDEPAHVPQAGPEPGPAAEPRPEPAPVTAPTAMSPSEAARSAGSRVETAAPRHAAAEPIAVVGLGCRLPGADSPDAFWRLLTDGVDASSDVPSDRFDAEAMLAEGPVTPGRIATRRGSFLDRIDGFDNAFFHVSAREARSMDPQQRLFLQVAYEALDDAGVRVDELSGSRVGLYVGLNTTDYMQLVTRENENIDTYYGTGNSFSGTAGRLSYFLGVRGPSIAVDTACASSLTAVHLACQALRAGEARLAVAGGSNVITNPSVYLAMSAAGALSPDGRCKTFSADADGYGRGEGAGAVVLKTLAQARADGDRVYAVLRGSAVNHNGASGGLTVPSGEAQEEVITDALARSGVEPADVAYVEAHGTGTRLGDGIELGALAGALGAGRPADKPLLTGSVKTNIGHLEAAAGIAGLIKTALALHHGAIPAHLHLSEPNRQVDWSTLPVQVTTRRRDWPEGPRLAGVSAFGFTGTNAHVVLESAGSVAAPAPPDGHRPLVLALSAAAEPALRVAAGRMRARLSGADAATVADVCHTAGARRSHLEHRLALVGHTAAELGAALAAYADRAADSPAVLAPHVHEGSTVPGEDRPFALVYTEDVPALPWRYWGATEPAFAAALDTVDVEARALLGRSARAALYEGTGAGPITDPLGVLAAHLALTALWRAHGVRPTAVVGRGIGEIGAACAGGLLDERAAVRAVAGRSDVRLTGTPGCAVHLDSVAADDSSATPAVWTPPSAGRSGAWRPEVARALGERGIETVLGVALDGSAAAALTTAEPVGPSAAEAAAAGGEVQELPAHHMAELHVRGCRVDFTALLGGRRPVVSLPAYAWQLRRHWIDDDRTAGKAPAPGPAPAEPRPVPAADTGPAAGLVAPLAAEVHSLPVESRPELMLTRVLAAVAEVLGEPTGADVDPDTGFFELGLDSVMAVALMEQLGRLLAVELEPTLTFEQPTSRALAGHLLDLVDLVDTEPVAAVAPRAPSAEPVAVPPETFTEPEEDQDDGLAELSDDDLANRLLDRIARSEALLNEVL
ncbi:type I polyketide synthase [Streptomyces sp. NPDC127119]|uniref:type I polyketide synthase n=1 Tax=Streptomyces sp. NPDC127119 TaxID=3345370 RepID=UPI00363B40BC